MTTDTPKTIAEEQLAAIHNALNYAEEGYLLLHEPHARFSATAGEGGYLVEFEEAGDDEVEVSIDGAVLAANLTGDLAERALAIISEPKTVIEICTCCEWLRVFGGCELPENLYSHTDEMASVYYAAAEKSLNGSDIFLACEIRGAIGQRSGCHGWNGAHFTHRAGGVGTMSTLTLEQLAAIKQADQDGCAAAAEFCDRLTNTAGSGQ
ncbi:MAG: hypothetical protein WC485_11700 [Opitutaceae bacterium]